MPTSGVSKNLYLSTFELYCVTYCFHSALFLTLVIFTARNEVGARLCFHRRVWFCSWGGSASVHAGMPPPPPGTRYPPPLGPGTPQDQAPPWDQAPSSRTRHHPPWQSMLGDTFNAWAVCILLECNLVLDFFSLFRVKLHYLDILFFRFVIF